jgi:hypothetical protein
MRTRFDYFDKELVRAALEDSCSVETDAEVSVDTRRIDLWFTPREVRALPDHLDLLGRMTAGPGTLEFFHNTPSGDELAACLVKHGDFRRVLSLRRRFGAQVDSVAEQRILVASTEQIEVWAERVLSAATLAELLSE